MSSNFGKIMTPFFTHSMIVEILSFFCPFEGKDNVEIVKWFIKKVSILS